MGVLGVTLRIIWQIQPIVRYDEGIALVNACECYYSMHQHLPASKADFALWLRANKPPRLVKDLNRFDFEWGLELREYIPGRKKFIVCAFGDVRLAQDLDERLRRKLHSRVESADRSAPSGPSPPPN